MLPQLRLRTEYSFRSCYGPIAQVAARAAALECSAAGIVDLGGTWGHVQWEKACMVAPMYGAEFILENSAHCWALATNLEQFYEFSSSNPKTEADFINAKGVLRFAGAALTHPDAFDYIDINPRSRLRTRHALALHKATGKPLVITSDNDYPSPADRLKFLAWDDSKKMTPQHILSEAELRHEFRWLPDDVVMRALINTHAAAERCKGLKQAHADLIHVEGDFLGMVEEGRLFRLKRGHIKSWTPAYQERLERELTLIEEKSYKSYFMVVAEMILWAKERMLVGPARGSAAGSLVCYLMQITEVDPLVHNLIFERFIDVNRFDLPDIDVDFNDQQRESVFERLRQKYGEANIARIGSVNRLKPRSVIAHVGKKLGINQGATFGVTNVLIEYSSGDSRYGNGLADTLTTTQPGKDFMKLHPEAALMGELENHASHSGQHAAGIIVSNKPVTQYCTVRDGIAHIDKKDAEYLDLLKIDALGLRTLGVIEDSGCITPQELYDLTLDDPEVFAIINDQKFSGVFQFEGGAQRRVSQQIPIVSFKQIDHITALARPGPLGGGAANTYINRNAGREEVIYRHPSMEAYLGDTMGVVLYQEQVMRICREIGQFSWADTAKIRRIMSKSVGKEFFDSYGKQFVRGASSLGIPKDEAQIIWDEICSFGAWGMNKSHTVSYAIISYWCAYMKRYHPLEYAAALLRNAKDDEQVVETLRELIAEGITYIPFDPDLSSAAWSAAKGKLIGGYTNLIGIGPVKAANYITKRETKGLSDKDRANLAKHTIKHNDLRPAHTLWQYLYDDPGAHNVNGPVKEFGDLKDRESAVVICKLMRQERRDENETVRAARRGGELKSGQTQFLDAFVVDDSVSKPVVLRLKPRMWEDYGVLMADRAVPGQDWFLVRGTWLAQFSMLSVQRIKCLTNSEMFE